MAIYSIADLHLGEKPMDVFGVQWTDHFGRISEDWLSRVQDTDIVLIPGDISWAMRLHEALSDLQAIDELTGRKIMIKGNHDYWWSSISRVRNACPPGLSAMQYDSIERDGYLFAGTRGWLTPGHFYDQDDERIYERELKRLEMSLISARKRSESLPLIGMMHYPPLTSKQKQTGFTELFSKFGASHVVYGHLHGPAIKGAFNGEHEGVNYRLVSCDGLDFKLLRVL